MSGDKRQRKVARVRPEDYDGKKNRLEQRRQARRRKTKDRDALAEDD